MTETHTTTRTRPTHTHDCDGDDDCTCGAEAELRRRADVKDAGQQGEEWLVETAALLRKSEIVERSFKTSKHGPEKRRLEKKELLVAADVVIFFDLRSFWELTALAEAMGLSVERRLVRERVDSWDQVECVNVLRFPKLLEWTRVHRPHLVRYLEAADVAEALER